MHDFLYYFGIFFIGALLGFVLETVWCLIEHHKIESRRGLIYSPIVPMYGVGALLITLVCNFLGLTTDLSVILAGTVLFAIIEYISSIIQEKFFGSKSWDYQHLPLNLHGRINLLYSLGFGVIGAVWYQFLVPLIADSAELIPHAILHPLLIILLIMTSLDMTISALACYRMAQRQKGIKAKNKFWQFFDRHYPDKRLLKIYANMEFVNKPTKTKH